jgi:hypothetical protein
MLGWRISASRGSSFGTNLVVEKNPSGCLSEFISRCFGVELSPPEAAASGLIWLLRKTLRAACQNLFPDARVEFASPPEAAGLG